MPIKSNCYYYRFGAEYFPQAAPKLIFPLLKETTMQNETTFGKSILAGVVSGVVSAILNNLYSLAHSAVTGFSIPNVIHIGSISGASVVTALVAGLAFFVLAKFIVKNAPKKRDLVYQIGAIGFALLSVVGSFGPTLPDGTPAPPQFAMLSAPMHVIAGVVAAFVIPKVATRG